MANCDPLPSMDSGGITFDASETLVSADCAFPVCPADNDIVELEVDRIATQYREAYKFLAMLRAFIRQVEIPAQVACGLPTWFDLPFAVSDQLTIIGKRMGFPRCHCVCVPVPVFGFDNCSDPCGYNHVVGFCSDDPSATWEGCAEPSMGTLCVSDDNLYRRMLYARAYQMMGLYDIASLTAAIQHLWGADAWVVHHGNGKAVVAPGRELSATERIQIPVAFRALPIAPGITPLIHYGGRNIFGFGEGWGGLCDGSEWLCPCDPHPYDCAA